MSNGPPQVTVRAVTHCGAEDYVALAALYTAANPAHAVSAEMLRHNDATRDSRCTLLRCIAACGERIVGVAECTQHPEMYHARKFALQLAVHPRWQGRGIGRALYAHVLRALGPLNPLSLRASVCDSRSEPPCESPSRAARFLQDRGFRAEMRFVELQLDVARCPMEAHVQTNVRQGAQPARPITIRTVAQVMRSARAMRDLHALVCAARADAPLPEAHTDVSFDAFVARTLRAPSLLRQGSFVAMRPFRATDAQPTRSGARARSECVGCTFLHVAAEPDALYVGFTGVRADCRRAGVATALKLHAIRFAHGHGFSCIRTVCAAENSAIRALNARLGFEEYSVWTSYVCDLAAE